MKSLRHAILFPDLLSIVLAVLAGLIVAFLANAGTFFEAYGYRASTELVHQSTHNVLITFLQRIDSFKLTDSIVTFLLWSFVGLFILALIQTISRIYGTVRSQLDISGSDYIKPATTTKRSIIEEVVFDILYLLLGMAVLLTMIVLFFSLLLPAANDLIRQLTHTHAITDFATAAIGIGLICAGTAAILYIARLTIYRHYFLPS